MNWLVRVRQSKGLEGAKTRLEPADRRDAGVGSIPVADIASVREPDRVVRIYEATPRDQHADFAPAAYDSLRGSIPALDSTGALLYGGGGTLMVRGEPERVLGVYVTPRFFETLGAGLLLGRPFRQDEEPNSVIITYSLWQRRFAADPSILGKQVALNDDQVTPIGVLDDHFWFANSQIELWRPLRFTGAQLADEKERTLTVIGRLQKSATLDQARTEAADQWRSGMHAGGVRNPKSVGNTTLVTALSDGSLRFRSRSAYFCSWQPAPCSRT